MENIAELLKQTRLLQGLSLESIQKYIVPQGIITEFSKDNFFIRENQEVNHIHILLRGKVNSYYYYVDGNYSLSEVIFPLQIVALDLIATKTRISPYYAIAAEPLEVFSFPTDLVLKPGFILEEERQIIISHLLVCLSHLHMKKEKHIIILSKNGLRDRIMTYLSMQAQMKKSPDFTIPFSREEMAAYLCVNRSTLSHELSLMRKEGIIDFSKNRFTMRKYGRLEE